MKKKKGQDACCAPGHEEHPSHEETLPKLNRAIGQLEGISRMISDHRYCVDILVQFRAAMAALRNIEVSVFESHLQHCVRTAMLTKDKKQIEAKIAELTELLSRRTSL